MDGTSVDMSGLTFSNWGTSTNFVTINGSPALANVLRAGSVATSLVGGSAGDKLYGGVGNDILNGGAGADTMTGGLGDDTYYVDNPGDKIVELPAQGNDTLYASVNYALAAGVAVNTMIATGTTAIGLTGNAFVNTLIGNTGANLLDGGGGADIMSGLGGNDTYRVDNVGDVVNEAAGGGADTVLTEFTYTLTAGQSIETFRTTNDAGTRVVDLTGNALAQSLFGNNAANVIDGKGGADAMTGFGGNDTYFVDNAGDVVTEAAAGGTDTAHSTIDYTLTANVENLIPDGSAAVNGTGNDAANAITGNAAANTLDGKARADFMSGLGGNDFYLVDNAGDFVNEAVGGGNDRVAAGVSYALAAGSEVEMLTTLSNGGTGAIDLTGNAFANAITGNAGANVIAGGAGNDTLSGLGGPDTFFFNTALNAATNVDRITDFNVPADTIRLAHAIFTTLPGGTLAANAFFTGAAAHDADDRVIYNAATGTLFYDSNGNAAGGATQFATLSTGLGMTNADFTVV